MNLKEAIQKEQQKLHSSTQAKQQQNMKTLAGKASDELPQMNAFKWELKNCLIAHFGQKHIITPGQAKAYEQLLAYFGELPGHCHKHGIDLKKGLMLVGPIGAGKTFIMKAFSRNQIRPFRVITCREIAHDFSLNGHQAMNRFTFNSFSTKNKKPISWLFDDLGAENTAAKYFGNQVNVMGEILLTRFEKWEKYPGLKTHITTNLTPDELLEMYGDRAFSRIKGMFNLINFGSTPDLRAKQ